MSRSMSGGPSRSGREEPFEEQAELDGVGVGDAERVADRRVGGATPGPGSRCPGLRQNSHDVPHDEEVAGEPQLLDDRQLVVDLGVGDARQASWPRSRAPDRGVRAVAASAPARPASRSQVISVWPGGHGEGGSWGATRGRSKAQVAAELGRPLDHPGVAGEAAGLLGPRAQVGARPAGQPAVDLVEAAPGPHRGQGGGQPAAGRAWRSARCWWPPASTPARTARSARASLRAESSGSPWSHSSTTTLLAPEGVDQAVQLPLGGGRAPLDKARGTAPLRQPVSTSQWSPDPASPTSASVPPARSARGGRPSPPPAGPSLMARASRAYPTGSRARTSRCVGPAGSGLGRAWRAGDRCPRVSSAPKTVGRPWARAASAKRTTP